MTSVPASASVPVGGLALGLPVGAGAGVGQSLEVDVGVGVGVDHWASDVIRSLVPDVLDVLDDPDVPLIPEGGEATAEAKVTARKRQFHAGRPLDLKPLPDGCTHQVKRK